MFDKDASDLLGANYRRPRPDVVVGHGRKNPNSQRGRERRGKKKKNPNRR